MLDMFKHEESPDRLAAMALLSRTFGNRFYATHTTGERDSKPENLTVEWATTFPTVALGGDDYVNVVKAFATLGLKPIQKTGGTGDYQVHTTMLYPNIPIEFVEDKITLSPDGEQQRMLFSFDHIEQIPAHGTHRKPVQFQLSRSGIEKLAPLMVEFRPDTLINNASKRHQIQNLFDRSIGGSLAVSKSRNDILSGRIIEELTAEIPLGGTSVPEITAMLKHLGLNEISAYAPAGDYKLVFPDRAGDIQSGRSIRDENLAWKLQSTTSVGIRFSEIGADKLIAAKLINPEALLKNAERQRDQ